MTHPTTRAAGLTPAAVSAALAAVPAGRGPSVVAALALEQLAQRRPGTADRAVPRQRERLWELNASVHCSVIGTCLTTAELRSVMAKVLQQDVSGMTDHDLHSEAVGLCSKHNACTKLLQKALDRRHQPSINRFAREKGEAAAMALWAEYRRAGDIPGAYWAVLTHPDVGVTGMRRAFGDVHMLSHMVGAANRADIRRLTALEEENAALADKVARQQQRLQEAVTSRDATIRRLGSLTAAGQARGSFDPDDVLAALRHLVDDLRSRLGTEIGRRERLERRLIEVTEAERAGQARVRRAEADAAALRREIGVLQPDEPRGAAGAGLRLPAERVLYVGGRPGTVEQARTALAAVGGELLSHDGGQHDHASLLHGLIGRADRVVFPVDCVSHDAALAVKRLCRQLGKPWSPLRSSGLTSFLACLGVPAEDAAAPAEPCTAECCP